MSQSAILVRVDIILDQVTVVFLVRLSPDLMQLRAPDTPLDILFEMIARCDADWTIAQHLTSELETLGITGRSDLRSAIFPGAISVLPLTIGFDAAVHHHLIIDPRENTLALDGIATRPLTSLQVCPEISRDTLNLLEYHGHNQIRQKPKDSLFPTIGSLSPHFEECVQNLVAGFLSEAFDHDGRILHSAGLGERLRLLSHLAFMRLSSVGVETDTMIVEAAQRCFLSIQTNGVLISNQRLNPSHHLKGPFWDQMIEQIEPSLLKKGRAAYGILQDLSDDGARHVLLLLNCRAGMIPEADLNLSGHEKLQASDYVDRLLEISTTIGDCHA